MTGAELFIRYKSENWADSSFGGLNFIRDEVAIEGMLFDNYTIMKELFNKIGEPLLIRLAFLLFEMEALSKTGSVDSARFNQSKILYDELVKKAESIQSINGGSTSGIKTTFIKSGRRRNRLC